MEYDFSGYATRNDLKCSDGRTIRAGAFKHNDGKKVPLCWQHGHNDPSNVLGHAVLENRQDGVYAYAKFNSTEPGKNAKLLVMHGDVNALSIYANELVEQGKNVIHGNIRELSLVLSGANPGAFIDNVVIKHGDSESVLDDEAIIYTGLTLQHNAVEDDEGEIVAPAVTHSEDLTVKDVFDSMTEEQRNATYFMIGKALPHASGSDGKEYKPLEHADGAGPTVKDIFDSMTEEQKNVVYFLIGQAMEDSGGGQAAHSAVYPTTNVIELQSSTLEIKEGAQVHNIFENHDKKASVPVLSHSDIKSIFDNAKRLGSFKESVEEYALKHGIENIDILFPDAKSVTNTPDFVKRRTEWVATVMSETRHTPFSRIKSMTADLTLEEARAKGYIKGNMKREEFFSVAKRVTTPQTIYKKQKLDRDDVVDITDFDIVAWLKEEMRVMLDEEVARAILIGDGRSNADDDKINETNIRPIASDSELYVTTVNVNIDDASSNADEIVDALTMHRRHYRGSGNPTFFTSESMLAQMLLAKDNIGRRLYPTVNDLAAALRVNKIVAVEVMENAGNLVGIMVNLADYTVGSDKGGAVNLFDDFDIDYNQFKYLIETRISGALTRPKSALVVRKVASTSVLVIPKIPTEAANVVTIPTDTNVVYKNKLTGTTLAQNSTVTLTAENATLTVVATPAAGKYFATDADDEWLFQFDAE